MKQTLKLALKVAAVVLMLALAASFSAERSRMLSGFWG
jgi:hypothetical protein